MASTPLPIFADSNRSWTHVVSPPGIAPLSVIRRGLVFTLYTEQHKVLVHIEYLDIPVLGLGHLRSPHVSMNRSSTVWKTHSSCAHQG